MQSLLRCYSPDKHSLFYRVVAVIDSIRTRGGNE